MYGNIYVQLIKEIQNILLGIRILNNFFTNLYDVSLEPARVLMKFCCHNPNEELFHRFRNIVNNTKFDILGPN